MLHMVRKVALVLIMCIALILSCMLLLLFSLPYLEGFRADVVEEMNGETPQAKINAYVRSVAKSDEETALSLWELPAWDLTSERSARLRARREDVPRTMIAQGIRPDPLILDIEWWGTCCEPRVVNNSRDAGGARIRVQLLDRNGASLVYVFDVFAREQPYWGGNLGYPPRQWVVRDVYALGQEPLFWLYKASIRRLDSPAPTTGQ